MSRVPILKIAGSHMRHIPARIEIVVVIVAIAVTVAGISEWQFICNPKRVRN